MNVVSSCSFACTAALVYQKRHRLSGAVLGLLSGLICQVAVMMLWNYLIAPIYMGYPREAVAALLLPAFLPFNLIKGGLNAAITLLLYKPTVTVLRRSNLIESGKSGKMRVHIGVIAVAAILLITCVLWILVLHGRI